MAVKQKIRASVITQIPSIPILSSLSDEEQREIKRWMLAIKENIELKDSASARGGTVDKAVTRGDMQNIGLDIDAFNAQSTPYNFEVNRVPVERWEYISIPAVSAGLGATNPADLTEITVDSQTYLWLTFQAASANETAHFTFSLPHSWVTTTSIKPVINWGPSTAAAGNVKWDLAYSLADVNGAFTSSGTDSVTIAASGTAFTNQRDAFSAISMAGKGIDVHFICRIERDQADAADTYGADAGLWSMGLRIQQDKFGSIQETTNKRG